MTFALAGIIVLALCTIALGLLAYNLFSRLHELETAVAGGLRTPSRLLTREEFSRRFTIAHQRADFAAQVGTGVVLFMDTNSSTSDALLQTLQHMSQRRGFTLAYRDEAPSVPDGVTVLAGLGNQFDTLGIPITPFCFVIDNEAIIEHRPVGSPAALDSLLLEVT